MVTRIANFEDYAPQDLTDGTTITFNGKLGQVAWVQIEGNRTLSVTNLIEGRAYQIFIRQGGAGGFTLNLPSNMKFTGNGVPAWSSTAGRVDILSFVNYKGTLFADFKNDFQPV